MKKVIIEFACFLYKRCLCIVMDFADGGDLYTRIAK